MAFFMVFMQHLSSYQVIQAVVTHPASHPEVTAPMAAPHIVVMAVVMDRAPVLMALVVAMVTTT